MICLKKITHCQSLHKTLPIKLIKGGAQIGLLIRSSFQIQSLYQKMVTCTESQQLFTKILMTLWQLMWTPEKTERNWKVISFGQDFMSSNQMAATKILIKIPLSDETRTLKFLYCSSRAKGNVIWLKEQASQSLDIISAGSILVVQPSTY